MAVERRKDNKNRVLKEGEYQRANGTFEYKWRDKRGKRHSIYAKTLEELREKEIDVLRDALDGVRTDKNNLTINDLYHLWVQLKRELKTATIDNIHTVLHQVLELGVEDDYLRYNPADNALKELKKAHNNDSEKRRALTLPEQEVFEAFLSKQGQYHRWFPIFTTMLWTGLRVGETVGLRWCDIDLGEETISVNHTLIYYSRGKEDGCSFAINTPKTEAGKRTIPMLPKVKEAFLLEKQYQGTLNKALRRIIRDCNYGVLDTGKKDAVTLPRFSNHTLRHTFTTRMCEAGVNIKAMQDILGHADAETTMDIYADATKELKKAELINFEDYFKVQKIAQIGTI